MMLRKLNANEKVQQETFYREKRLHDETSALGSARREGKNERETEIVDAMCKKGFTEEQIKDPLGDWLTYKI